MKKESMVIIGGGGHGKVVIDLLECLERYKIVGIVDPGLEKGSHVLGLEVLGDDSVLADLRRQEVQWAALGIGSWGDNTIRDQIYFSVREKGFHFPTLIHPKAYVSKHSRLSDGIQIMAQACVQPNVTMGENSVINTGTIIEHDCQIGRNLYTGSNANLSGWVSVGDSVFIGSSACIIPKVTVGKKSFIAAGAVVIKDVAESDRVKGVPAQSF